LSSGQLCPHFIDYKTCGATNVTVFHVSDGCPDRSNVFGVQLGRWVLKFPQVDELLETFCATACDRRDRKAVKRV
jgi:hypothetical protein